MKWKTLSVRNSCFQKQTLIARYSNTYSPAESPEHTCVLTCSVSILVSIYSQWYFNVAILSFFSWRHSRKCSCFQNNYYCTLCSSLLGSKETDFHHVTYIDYFKRAEIFSLFYFGSCFKKAWEFYKSRMGDDKNYTSVCIRFGCGFFLFFSFWKKKISLHPNEHF